MEAIYSELVIAKESATITWVLTEKKTDGEVGKLYCRKKGKAQVCPNGEAVGGIPRSRAADAIG